MLSPNKYVLLHMKVVKMISKSLKGADAKKEYRLLRGALGDFVPTAR